MPVPLNITLTPAAPYVSLFGASGASSWLEAFSSGTFGNWSQWTTVAGPPSSLTEIIPSASFMFNGSNIAIYGTMQWKGEGYNLTVTPEVPATGLVERWQGCDPISVCLSEPGVLWERHNLTGDSHYFSISTNYNLGVNTRGPTLTVTHVDITADIPGDESSSRIANQSIPTSQFILSPEAKWMRASNGSLYTNSTNCTLSINFTGTAILLTTAQSMDGFSPYHASIDTPVSNIHGDSQPNVGVVRRGEQADGEVMYLATGLENTDHFLNIRTTGGFAISRAYTYQAISRATADEPATAPGVVSSLSSSANSLWYPPGYFLLATTIFMLLIT